MRNWNSLYDILSFPIGILYFAMTLLGIGNILTNSAFSVFFTMTNELVILLAEVCIRTGTFLVVNFPLFFMLRLVTRKSGSATGILSAFAGYIAYLTMTMCFAGSSLPSTAFSSILGLSITSARAKSLAGAVHYPLQTGVIGAGIVALIALYNYNRTRKRSDYNLFAFISKDTQCVIGTVILSAAAGFGMAYAWPYAVRTIHTAVEFISSDTTNPVNLMIYGVLDRFSSLLNIGAMIRTPFWYGSNGGTWLNMVGSSVAGDVNIWTAQAAIGGLTGMAGRFITPYYVLNIFAVPGLLWAMYSLKTDYFEKRRTRLFYILASLLSIFSGTLLPLEITLFFAAPALYFFHLLYTGLLFGIFQAMGVYLGFNYAGGATLTALPGTLLELLSYLQFTSLQKTLLMIAAAGVISFFVYFLFTRFYYKYLALDLFQTGRKNHIVKGVIDAVGGVDNIKLTHSSTDRLVISLYDPTKLDANKIRSLGSVRVYDTKAGYAITFGAASTMVRLGISESMRESIRSTV